MSVVTIARKGNTCAIAADTLSSFGSTLQGASNKRNGGKIARLQENCFGLVGYAAHDLVLLSLLKRHPEKFRLTDRLAVFETMLELHPLMKEEYHLVTSESDSDQPYESSQMVFCLANSSGIYLIESYREVTDVDRFWAIGSGQSFALGAMEALYQQEDQDAESIARAGALAACQFNAWCAEPIDSFSIALHRSERTEEKPYRTDKPVEIETEK